MCWRPSFAIIVSCGLVACTQFPDLEDALSPASERAEYPDLLPIEELNTRVPEAQLTPEAMQSIEARVAALRARASRLRGTVIDSSTRARMTAGVEEI